MSVAKKVAYNTIVQVVGRLLGLLVTLVTVSYVANHLIVDGSALNGYGQYTIIFTYVSVLAAVADFGLFTLVVREISGKSGEEASRILGNALGFRVVLFLLGAAGFTLLYFFLPYQEVVRQGILIGVVIAFSMLSSQMIGAVFQANLMADRIVVTEIIGKLFITAGTILSLRLGHGLIAIVTVNLLGQILIFLLSCLLARRLVRISIQFDLAFWRKLLPQFWTIALINLLALIHFKTDTLLLTFYKPEADVGIYGVAYKIFEVILIIPSIFAANLVPVLTSFISERRHVEVGQVIKRSSSMLFIVAAYLATVVFVYSEKVIVFVTQPDFIAASGPLRILAVSIFFIFLTTLLSQAVVANRNQNVLVRGYLFVIALNIALNMYAIPRYSYIGAAVTTAMTEACLLWYTLTVCRRNFRETLNLDTLSRVIIATIISLAVLLTAVRYYPVSLSDYSQGGKIGQALILVKDFTLAAAIYLTALWATFGGSVKKIKQLFIVR